MQKHRNKFTDRYGQVMQKFSGRCEQHGYRTEATEKKNAADKAKGTASRRRLI